MNTPENSMSAMYYEQPAIICADMAEFDSLNALFLDYWLNVLGNFALQWANPIIHPTTGAIAIPADPVVQPALNSEQLARVVILPEDWFYVAPPDPAPALRSEARYRLQQSQWVLAADVTLANIAEWTAYRAAVLAIYKNPTAESVFPTEPDVTWPAE